MDTKINYEIKKYQVERLASELQLDRVKVQYSKELLNGLGQKMVSKTHKKNNNFLRRIINFFKK